MKIALAGIIKAGGIFK